MDVVQWFKDAVSDHKGLAALVALGGFVAAFPAYLYRLQSTFWAQREASLRSDLTRRDTEYKNLKDELERSRTAFDNELRFLRDDIDQRSAQNVSLRNEVLELRDAHKEIIRQKLSEGDREVMATIEQISEYMRQLEEGLRQKSEEVERLSMQKHQNERLLHILWAEMSLSENLIARLDDETSRLFEAVASNITIADKLETAVLDPRRPAKLLAYYKQKMASLRTEALVNSASTFHQAKNAAKGKAERQKLAEAKGRVESGATKAQELVLKQQLPTSDSATKDKKKDPGL